MGTLEIRVREDGAVFIPASEVANLGIKPGETLAAELRPHLIPSQVQPWSPQECASIDQP